VTRGSRIAWLATAGIFVIGVPSGRAQAETPDWGALVDRVAPAVVNLRITLRTEMEGTGAPAQESTEEVRGVLVDPTGLILVWNSHFSAGRMTELFADGSAPGGFRVKVTPTEIRVSIPGEAREREAFLAASDGDLDLAFVQLEEPPAAPLPAVTFTPAAALRIGTELATVSRMSSGFDRVPFFDLARVAGELRRPRPAWILAGGNATQVGMPYFTADGVAAGVLVTFVSRSGDPTTRNTGKLFAELLSLGRGQSEVGPVGLFLLPAERVRGVVEAARARAGELLAERREEGADAPP
jgi:hypothetical protein